MTTSHSTVWQAQLSQAIVEFPLWGRLKPNSARGHAITAFAFLDWSKGGLGIFSCESPVKSIGLHLYACTLTAEYFEGVFVDWKEGWCSNVKQSNTRFEEDAGRGNTVYSYAHGALDTDGIDVQRKSMNAVDTRSVSAMVAHLNNVLGVFDWSVWSNTASALASTQKGGLGISFVEPVALAAGGYLLPINDPYHEQHSWPTQLSGDELCGYLGASPRQNLSIDFFAFQERIDAYISNNRTCVWDASHSARLLTLFGKGLHTRATTAAHFFSVWEHSSTWPAPATRVIAPRFVQYIQSFLELMAYSGKDQLDGAWLAASHFTPDTNVFDMFDTVFKGLSHLDGSERLQLGGTAFRLEGSRGARGRLLAMETSVGYGDGSTLDTLRQVRAWCGGILSVDYSLFTQAPHFWNARFKCREVAALLNEDGAAICAHPYFYYDKHSVDGIKAMSARNSNAFLEYSLFQGNPTAWRSRQGGELESPWGWKILLDTQTPSLTNVAKSISARWVPTRTRWLHTMGPSDAAAVYSILGRISDWPFELDEFKMLSDYYLQEEPALFALCEMMDFDTNGVLVALSSCALQAGVPKHLDPMVYELPEL